MAKLHLNYKQLLIALLGGVLAVTTDVPWAQAQTASTISASAVVARTNSVRAEVGLPALAVNSRLSQSAQAKADDMATKGYFDHGSPEGYRMGYWISGAGYVYALAGENLAKGFTNIDRLMSAWVASPSHYKNLVEPKFTNIGVGIAEGVYQDQPTVFVVQHFGVPPTTATKLASSTDQPVPLVTASKSTEEKAVVSSTSDNTIPQEVAQSNQNSTQTLNRKESRVGKNGLTTDRLNTPLLCGILGLAMAALSVLSRRHLMGETH